MNELPLGFAFKLAMDSSAMSYYSSLSPEIQEKITSYILNSKTNDDAKERIEKAVNNLSNSSTNFFND